MMPLQPPLAMDSSRPHILVLGPARTAVSGVSTHLNHLFDSPLSDRFRLSQYQVGGEDRVEGKIGALLRVLTSPFDLTARLLRDRPSILHINTSFHPRSYWRDLAYLATAKILRVKVVYQVHGGPFPREFFASSPVLTALLRRILFWPDVVVLLSTFHMKAYGDFAPGANLVMLAYGVEVQDVDLNFERYAADRPLEVVNIGRLLEAKGVFDIVEAVRILRSRDIHVRLRFVGSGPAEPTLRRMITETALGDRITLLDPVFGAAKHELWGSAHVLALPTYSEGLPLALLESMSAGAVPVITPVGGIPDVVRDRVHGLFVAPRSPIEVADALQQLHEDRESLWRMALAGRQRIVEQYSVTRFTSEFQRLYATLV